VNRGNDNQPERKAGNTTIKPANTERTTARPATGNRTVAQPNTSSNNSGTTNRSAQSVRGNTYTPKTDVQYEQARRTYETPARKNIVRTTTHTTYVYRPIEYRRVHYVYRAPVVVDLYWSIPMYRQYRTIYPEYDYWYYPVGYRIHTISAYDAEMYVGELARVYGRIDDVWYSRSTKEYYLYIGGPYPYQDFSVIIPHNVARRFNRNPERFFRDQYIAVTGLISRFEDKPEMLIRKSNQIEVY
jgi:hypothetical protein